MCTSGAIVPVNNPSVHHRVLGSERWAPVAVSLLLVELQQLSAPSSPYCCDLCSTVHTWSTTTALHTGIFHFLFSVTPHSPAPPPNGPQTDGKTSGALQLQHAWYVRPAPMTQAVERMETYWFSIVNKATHVTSGESQWKFQQPHQSQDTGNWRIPLKGLWLDFWHHYIRSILLKHLNSVSIVISVPAYTPEKSHDHSDLVQTG